MMKELYTHFVPTTFISTTVQLAYFFKGFGILFKTGQNIPMMFALILILFF